jgi:dihydropteroate synthase
MIKINYPSVMGIINLNPDSFFSESRCTTENEIISKFEKMIEEEADIIDLGACSTRPGLKSIPEELEWEYLNQV